MRPYIKITKARWQVNIKRNFMSSPANYYWDLTSTDNTGLHGLSSLMSGGAPTIEIAEADFVEWAELNGIEDYNIFKFTS